MSEAQQGIGTQGGVPLENGENTMKFDLIEWHFKQLAGRLLTLADASFIDPQQRKAVKDLMRMQIRDQLQDVSGYCNPCRSVAEICGVNSSSSIPLSGTGGGFVT